MAAAWAWAAEEEKIKEESEEEEEEEGEPPGAGGMTGRWMICRRLLDLNRLNLFSAYSGLRPCCPPRAAATFDADSL